jgi:spore germination protein
MTNPQSIEDTYDWLTEQFAECADLEYREMQNTSYACHTLYLKSICEPQTVYRHIVAPFFDAKSLAQFEYYVSSFPGTEELTDAEDMKAHILMGYVLIVIGSRAYLLEARMTKASQVTEAKVEAIVQGPDDAFNEDIETNINLVRRRYESADLKIEIQSIGTKSQTKIAIMFDNAKVDFEVLAELRKRLASLQIEILQSTGALEKLLSAAKISIFPTMVTTERPDRTVKCINEGKIAILVSSTGYALILPSVFGDFFTAMDDKIQLPFTSFFLKSIRYIGLFITLTLPAFYVAFTSYNPEILKAQVALLIGGSRASVPYPAFVEVLLMLTMMEFLVEASLRLPKAVGPTATTVGGLILGQAATEAGLVGNIMIILVSAVAISNFVIPITMMNYSIRVIKYAFVLLATVFGLVGIVVGMLATIMYLSHLTSFGKPYFQVQLPFKGGK